MALKLNLPQNSRLLHSPRVFFFDFSPYLYLNITLNRYFELPNRRRLYWKIKKNLNNEKNVILLVCFETYWTKDFNKQRNATKFTIITLSSRYLYRLQISLLPFHLVFIRQNLFQHSPSAATISPHVRAHMLHGRTHAYAGTHAYTCACVREVGWRWMSTSPAVADVNEPGDCEFGLSATPRLALCRRAAIAGQGHRASLPMAKSSEASGDFKGNQAGFRSRLIVL